MRNFKSSVMNIKSRLSACRLNAVFTLEAAIIVSLSLFLICSAILVSMHVHDIAVLRAVSISTVFGEYNSSAGVSEIEEAVCEALDARLIAADDICAEASLSSGEYLLTCTASSNTSSGIFGSYIGSVFDTSTVTINISNLDGRDALLKYRLAKEGLLSVIGE